ncbi:MAG TPA: hypothetical protein VGO84_18210 [Burkholderiales bacterium]|nr:hypothetical protein [Burkholderiales bacterium]
MALQNQRDDLLAFAGVLDEKLATIAQATDVPAYLVRTARVLHRNPDHLAGVLARLQRVAIPTGRPIPRRVRRLFAVKQIIKPICGMLYQRVCQPLCAILFSATATL